jgi:hypothetical protein
MIATKLAVLMAVMIMVVVGLSVAALPAAEAGPIVTSRSNIKAMNIVQQEASCEAECSIEQNMSIEGLNAETGDDFSTNDWSNSPGDFLATSES